MRLALQVISTYKRSQPNQHDLKGHNNRFLKRTKIFLGHIKTNLYISEGVLIKTKKEAGIKLTVETCCQIFD